MIPYEDLVAALTSWRQRNGLPTGGAEYVAAPSFNVDVIAGEGDFVTDASELEIDAAGVEEIYEVGEVDELEVVDDSRVELAHDVDASGVDPHTFDEGAEASDDGAGGGYDAVADDAEQLGGYDDGAAFADDDGAAYADEPLQADDAAHAESPLDEEVSDAVDHLLDEGPDETFDVDESTMVAQVGDLAELHGDSQSLAADGMDLGTLDEDSTSIGSLPTDDDDVDDRS